MRSLKHRIWKYVLRFVHFCVYHQECVAELRVRNATEVSGIFFCANFICCYPLVNARSLWLMNKLLDIILLFSCRKSRIIGCVIWSIAFG